MPSLYQTTPETGTVSSSNSTSLYSNTTDFTTGIVTSAVASVNAGTGISVNPTTGNVVVTNTGVTSVVAGSGIAVSGSTGAVTISSTSIGTTYAIDASTTSGGANFNLTGSDATTDTVKFANGSGITVSRTDANTITITNSNPGGTGVTSVTGTANQIIVSSPTGAITLSTPQDIATTSNPTFAGATLGAVTVGVATNNTITTTSGDLDITATGTNGVNITSGTDEPTRITRNSTTTNTSIRSLALSVQSTGTPAVGFGNSLEYEVETAVGNTERAGFVSVNSTDVTPGSEDFSMFFGLMTGGAAASSKMVLANSGNLTLDGGIRLSGSTSGSSIFSAPATGSVLSYILPGTAGAASTVLTNDGSGNLTWALPGGGGSTFGNITIAVVDDNTISTTTGDLDITAVGNNGVNITSGSDGPTLISRTSTVTNTNIRSLGLNSQTSGTPVTGIGNSIEFSVETAPGVTTVGGYLSVTSTDITPGSEDFKMSFGLMEAGAVYTEVAQFNSVGDLTIDGFLTIANNQATVNAVTLTTTATTTVPLTTSTRNAMSVLVNIIQGANVHCVNATLLRVDATTALLTTYGEMYNTTSLANFTADVSAGSMRLLITPTSATSTVFSAVRTSLT